MEAAWTLEELVARVARALDAGDVRALNGRVTPLPDRRVIRWYATIGLVDRPLASQGRTARYGRRHLLQLVAIKRRQAEGATLADIQVELAGATDATLARIAGIPTVDPDAAMAVDAAAAEPATFLPPVNGESLADTGPLPGIGSWVAAGPVAAPAQARAAATAFWARAVPPPVQPPPVQPPPVQPPPVQPPPVQPPPVQPPPVQPPPVQPPPVQPPPVQLPPAQPQTRTPSPAPPVAAGELLHGVRLAGAVLLLPAHPDAADLAAIHAAAQPLLDLLVHRGLLPHPGGSTT